MLKMEQLGYGQGFLKEGWGGGTPAHPSFKKEY